MCTFCPPPPRFAEKTKKNIEKYRPVQKYVEYRSVQKKNIDPLKKPSKYRSVQKYVEISTRSKKRRNIDAFKNTSKYRPVQKSIDPLKKHRIIDPFKKCRNIDSLTKRQNSTNRQKSEIVLFFLIVKNRNRPPGRFFKNRQKSESSLGRFMENRKSSQDEF